MEMASLLPPPPPKAPDSLRVDKEVGQSFQEGVKRADGDDGGPIFDGYGGGGEDACEGGGGDEDDGVGGGCCDDGGG